jgi:hypothetical protein
MWVAVLIWVDCSEEDLGVWVGAWYSLASDSVSHC